MLTGVLVIIFFAALACLLTEGIWGNMLRLINVVTASLVATSTFEPVADWLQGRLPSFEYLLDFLAIWGVFGICMIVFRLLTDNLSKVKIKFLKIAEQIGSPLLAVWVAWVMVCFTATTLHTAPLARNPMRGSFVPEEAMLPMGLKPARQWLAFTQQVSLGAFARSDTIPGQSEGRAFDPRGEFLPKYATRRANLEGHVKSTDGKILVR